ncbi:Hypothetical predicted protein [Pelobates cultripes]|uniref:Uncharacterized protein n=1 Tax=Pelobates cultripes TaxID=61616 RepID=A0AAD1SPD8_PELCU|nr:Hypothetical predicted protein [Pelobates cultripes]
MGYLYAGPMTRDMFTLGYFRMTSNISTDTVQYLDLEISVKDYKIAYSLFSKPTDRNIILHYDSAHPMALKKSLSRNT